VEGKGLPKGKRQKRLRGERTLVTISHDINAKKAEKKKKQSPDVTIGSWGRKGPGKGMCNPPSLNRGWTRPTPGARGKKKKRAHARNSSTAWGEEEGTGEGKGTLARNTSEVGAEEE